MTWQEQQKLRDDVLEEVAAWMDSETPGFVEIIGRILASLPGGDALDGIFEPLAVGWKEVELLAKLLSVLNDSGDVAEAVRVLFFGSGEGEEEG
jgi:hypothetical protein